MKSTKKNILICWIKIDFYIRLTMDYSYIWSLKKTNFLFLEINKILLFNVKHILYICLYVYIDKPALWFVRTSKQCHVLGFKVDSAYTLAKEDYDTFNHITS